MLIDPDAAEQAIENLLSNAMKYSPDTARSTSRSIAPTATACVRVTDRGIGIPPRLQRKIFRKFYRVQTDAGSAARRAPASAWPSSTT